MSGQARTVEQPMRWPLVQQPANRSENWTRDARLVNCIAEKDPNTGEWQIQKRIGFSKYSTPVAGGFGRGAYSWSSPTTIGAYNMAMYAVISSGANASFCNAGAVAVANFGPDCTGLWNFTQINSATPYIVFTSPGSPTAGRGALYYTNLAAVTAAALPAARGTYICGVANLDETIYIMDENCNIYGSNLNDVSTWSALNVVSAQNIPGWGVGLVKQLSYLIALKTSSMEVFYDAGNATGSPLLQIDGATNSFGCAAHELIQVIDDILLYPSSNTTGAMQIVRVDNLVPTVVSTPAIEKLISSWLRSTGTYYSDLYSFSLKYWGHRLYGITSIFYNLTLVYDIDQKLWYQWTDYQGNYFPLFCAAIDTEVNPSPPPLENLLYRNMLGVSDSSVYSYAGDSTYPTDNGNVAPVDIYTPTTDFGTRRSKTLHRLYVDTDQQPGSVLQCRCSDNDMQSWSNFRKVDLSRQDPYLDNEGSFVKRAYHFRHAAATPFRIRSGALQMDFGTM